jgi:predicted ArsR family transcriptional regulator
MPKPQAIPYGTKLSILQLLLREELTPTDIADRLGVTPTAVRQHLAALSANGLVDRRRQPVGPSRPPEVYRLSTEGRRAFPKRYDLLVSGLVDVLMTRLGKDETLDTVAAAARWYAERLQPLLRDAPESERWPRLKAMLEEEFAWDAEAAGANGVPRRLLIHQCPFQDVSTRHPGVCGIFFSTVIRTLLCGVSLEHAPNAPGEACCAFELRNGGGS